MDALYFERTIRRILGDRAYGLAGTISTNRSYRRRWIRKALRHIERRIGALDTTPFHRELMACEVARIRATLGRNDDPAWPLVDSVFALVGSLLGFTTGDGEPRYEATYFQTHDQYYAERAERRDPADRLATCRNAYATRRQLMAELKAQGFSVFEISLVFQTSQHKVTELLKGPH